MNIITYLFLSSYKNLVMDGIENYDDYNYYYSISDDYYYFLLSVFCYSCNKILTFGDLGGLFEY